MRFKNQNTIQEFHLPSPIHAYLYEFKHIIISRVRVSISSKKKRFSFVEFYLPYCAESHLQSANWTALTKSNT